MSSTTLSSCSRVLLRGAAALAAASKRSLGALRAALEQGPREPGNVVADVRALAHALPRRGAGLPAEPTCFDGRCVSVCNLPLL